MLKMWYVGLKTLFICGLFFLFGCFGLSSIDSKMLIGNGLPGPDLELVTLSAPYSLVATPRLRVSNTKPGSVLKVFSGANCVNHIEDVISTTDSFEFELQNPIAASGIYHFSVLYELNGIQSNCSENNIVYHFDPDFSIVEMKEVVRSIDETNAILNVEVQMTPAKTYDVSVGFNFGGTKVPINGAFSAVTRQVVIPAGQTTTQIPVQLIDDGIKNLDAMINVNLESTSTTQVRIGSQPSTRIYVQDSSAVFKTISKLEFDTYGSCALLSDSSIKCWGDIGGALVGYQKPTLIDSGVSYGDVTAHGGSKCGITTLGTLKCWGSFPGNGIVSSNISAPYTHAGSYGFVKAFDYGVCAVRTNGDLYCWGENTGGRLGNGNSTRQNGPVLIDSGVSYQSAIMGFSTTCAITSGQQVKCWGVNTYGQLGDGTLVSRTLPAGVIDGGQTYSKLALYYNSGSVCGLTTGQKIKCWGRNNFGQLGDGTNLDSPIPVSVDPTSDYADIQMHNEHVCAITTAGVLKCWGGNANGKLGDGSVIAKNVPTVIDPGTLYSKIYPQGGYTCGITAVTGNLKCWGSIYLGNANLGSSLVPMTISSPFSFSTMGFANNRLVAVTSEGFLLMVGDEYNGVNQFGLGFPNTPTLQDPERRFIALSYLCRIDSNSKLFCRGYSDGTNRFHKTFIAVDASHEYTQVSSNWNSTCAVRSDGKLFCWGSNVGDGTTEVRYSPLEIDSGFTHTMVSVGSATTCAIRTNGQLICWGENSQGTLGNNSTINSTSPVEVDIGSLYEKVSVEQQACGIIRTTGVLKCWGDGFRGKVGHNTAVDQLTPLVIDPGVFYKDVEAIDQHTCGITITGDLKCWGRNFWDEVGDGTGVNRFIPTLIDNGTAYDKVGAGSYDHTCAQTSTGLVKCWGENSSGQSGPSGSFTVTTPQTVAGLTGITNVYSGGSTSCAIDSSGYLWCWGKHDFSVEYGLGITENSAALNQLILRNLLIEGD
jgi:large repetitive protein